MVHIISFEFTDMRFSVAQSFFELEKRKKNKSETQVSEKESQTQSSSVKIDRSFSQHDGCPCQRILQFRKGKQCKKLKGNSPVLEVKANQYGHLHLEAFQKRCLLVKQ